MTASHNSIIKRYTCACCGEEVDEERCVVVKEIIGKGENRLYFGFPVHSREEGKSGIILCVHCNYNPKCIKCGKEISRGQACISIENTGISQCGECISKNAPEKSKKKSRGACLEWRSK